MSIADNFIKSGKYKNILLVGAEIHSKGLDKTTRGRDISVLFGDGAGAVVIQAYDSDDFGVLAADLHADGSFAKELWMGAPGSAYGDSRINTEMIENGNHWAYMNGKTVFVHAVKRMSETLTTSLI